MISRRQLIVWPVIILVVLVGIQIIYFTVTKFTGKEINYISAEMNLSEKIIHLDLKGAPPLVSYLKEFFPFIKKLGATGILIEYEDTFPYRGMLEEIKAVNAYTRSDIQEILYAANSHGLKVIPLIQVFGHLEFVLKLKSFQKYREVQTYPQSLCPSHKEAYLFIWEMIDQVMELHPNISHLHIGCDEVFYLGQCMKCRQVTSKNIWSKIDLYFDHVKKVAKYIKKNYPGVVPIVWSEEHAYSNEILMKKHRIHTLVDQMIWNYRPELLGTENELTVASRLSQRVWIASAYKGATGMNAVITNAYYHIRNQRAWKSKFFSLRNSLEFAGIVLTGWQRYDHFAELCELLPMGTPSLAANLLFILGKVGENFQPYTSEILGCNTTIVFAPSDLNAVSFYNCDFPGFDVYSNIIKFQQFKSSLVDLRLLFTKISFSKYNIMHDFYNPVYARRAFNSLRVEEISNELNMFEKNLTEVLSEIYDIYTVREWISVHVTPTRLKWNALDKLRKTVLTQRVWPRRPLKNGIELLQNISDEICNFKRPHGCVLLFM